MFIPAKPEETDFQTLLPVFAGSFIFFWFCYILSSLCFSANCKGNKIYQEMPDDKKADYLSRVVANIHAVISCIAACASFFYTW